MELPGMQLPVVAPYRAGDDFDKWVRGIERYLSAVDIKVIDRKCAVLLHLVGSDTADISETLPEAVGVTGDRFEKLKQKLSAYLSPVKNAVTERAAFHHMSMRPEEEFEQFLGRLRVQALRCGYTAAETDRELRDRCIVGSSPGLREKLLQEAANKGDAVTLDNIRQTARAYRDMRQLSAQLAGTQQPVTGADNEGQPAEEQWPEVLAVQARSTQTEATRPPRTVCCYRCGAAGHIRRDCPERQSPGQPEAIIIKKKDAWICVIS